MPTVGSNVQQNTGFYEGTKKYGGPHFRKTAVYKEPYAETLRTRLATMYSPDSRVKFNHFNIFQRL